MKKIRRIKISFRTTEYLAARDETGTVPDTPDPHTCPLCHSQLPDAVQAEMAVISDEVINDYELLPEHSCR